MSSSGGTDRRRRPAWFTGFGAGSDESSFAWLTRGATSFVSSPSSAVKGLEAEAPREAARVLGAEAPAVA